MAHVCPPASLPNGMSPCAWQSQLHATVRFQPGAACPIPSGMVRLVASALVSKGLDGLVIQSDPEPCGSVQSSWAEQQQNRARADVDEATPQFGRLGDPAGQAQEDTWR